MLNIINEKIADKVYWINMRTRADRFIKMSTRLKNEYIIAERYQAIYGGAVSKIDVDFSGTMQGIGRRLNPGEIGCYLSHRDIWKKVLKSSYKRVLILEDDCIFKANYKEVLGQFNKEIGNDYDLFFLGQNNYNKNSIGEMTGLVDIGKAPVYKSVSSWLTHAYVVTPKACEILLEHTNKAYTCLDGMIADKCKDMTVYAIAPAIAIQDITSKSSLR